MKNTKPKTYIQKIKIISNTKIRDNYFKIIINAPEIAKISQPGQFLQVKVAGGYEPFLRRPFGIHRVMGSRIIIIYEVVGRGSRLLSEMRAGGYLDILGPLGNGFKISSEYSRHILIAGGMGVAPLLFLAEKLKEIQNPKCKIQNRIMVLLGAKTQSQILCEKEFRKIGCDVGIATDDGSRGFNGRVTDLLENLLSAKRYPLNAILYACGPEAMQEAIALIARRNNICAQISLEAYMACGFGVCMGCATNTSRGYKLVCKDGPIFNAADILRPQK